MNEKSSHTIEEALFERMGVTVDDALATATDVLDERVAAASQAGVELEPRLAGLSGLLLQLSEPQNLQALQTVIDRLPQLAELAQLAADLPNMAAAAGDVLDEFAQRQADDGLDLERSLTNGLRAVLWLGCQIDAEHLRRLGILMQSDILSDHSISVVDNAASALNQAQADRGQGQAPDRIGLFGLLKALRQPEIQRSLAFAARFGSHFGDKLNDSKS